MSNYSAAHLLQVARSHIGEVKGNNDCARFVSQVFEEADCPKFKSSSGVRYIEAQYAAKAGYLQPGDTKDPVEMAACGDLIFFGDDKKGNGDGEHVMIYSGNGNVIGTSWGPDGQTRVREVGIDTITTDNYQKAGTPPRKIGKNLLSMEGTPDEGSVSPVQVAQEALGMTASAVANFASFAWVPGLLANAGVLVLILVLAAWGLRKIVDATPAGDYAT